MDFLILVYGLLISFGLFLYCYGVAMSANWCLNKDYISLYYFTAMIGFFGIPVSIIASFVI